MVRNNPKDNRDSRLALLIFGIVAIAYAFPVIQNLFMWGQMCWDQFTFWNAAPREVLLRYRQFPLWNPYVNGGNVLLAHPHSPFLSPFYVFVLFFGPVVGLKIEIIVHLVIGMFGMYRLSRYWKLSGKAAYLSAFVFMLNSMFILHLTEGHTSWLPMAFIPWLFLYYQKSLKDPKYILGAIVFLALMLLAGSVDVINMVNLFLICYTILKMVEQRNLQPLRILVLILAGTFLLCAIKLLPMLEFLDKNPRVTYEHNGASLPVLTKMLLGRDQAAMELLSNEEMEKLGFLEEWHEYGAYVGIIPLILFLFGLIHGFRRHWPLIMTGFVFLFIAMGEHFAVDLWANMQKLPIYGSLTCPTRYILMFVFCVAVFSAQGLSWIEKIFWPGFEGRRVIWGGVFSTLILGVVLLDLFSVNAPIFRNTFLIEPLSVQREREFRQTYREAHLFERDRQGRQVSRSSQYPIFLSNKGLLDSYEVVHIPQGNVRVVSDPDYRGEIYLAGGNGVIKSGQFSPSRIEVSARIEKPDLLVVNQNYDRGWKVKVGNEGTSAESFQGLIAARVSPGLRTVTFLYRPWSFVIGLFITLIFIFCMGIVIFKGKR